MSRFALDLTLPLSPSHLDLIYTSKLPKNSPFILILVNLFMIMLEYCLC
ncbi:hypothetical protein NIES3974_30840 [Calothrix sp. NIES-3974]|nr:hypothetical protein NIES3974_30840 [Calothrix sp. NIES-3974]